MNTGDVLLSLHTVSHPGKFPCANSLPHLIYPLTSRVVGAPQTISQPVSSIFFLVLHCSLGLGELQACLLPDVVFPPLPLSSLSSSPLSLCLVTIRLLILILFLCEIILLLSVDTSTPLTEFKPSHIYQVFAIAAGITCMQFSN